MQYVPVVGASGKALMPCHPARARQLVKKGRARRKFDRGLFYIQLLDREDGERQPIAVGIDPGSKKEALTVKSTAHTYLNIQADAVTWVKDAEATSSAMRRGRRSRKTPYRLMRVNRRQGQFKMPPSTRARWGWKLRLCRWLARYYPVSRFVVEDVAAISKVGRRRWNQSFSPLEVGKRWFYTELGTLAPVETRQGYQTKALRDELGLKKSKQKLSDKFEAHCLDSWVLANGWVGGHTIPDNTTMLYLVPLRFHRRQLHRLQPDKGNARKPYGGSLSLGFKRGSWVRHPRYGVCYVGGSSEGRLSLHNMHTGQRLCQNAKPQDLKFLCTASWRLRKGKSAFLPHA